MPKRAHASSCCVSLHGAIPDAGLCWVWPASRVPAGAVDTALSYCHYTLNDRSLQA